MSERTDYKENTRLLLMIFIIACGLAWGGFALAKDGKTPGRDEAVALCSQGETHVIQGQPDKALSLYKQAYIIFKNRFEADPEDKRAHKDLGVIADRFGDIFTLQDRLYEAIDAYLRSLKIMEELALKATGVPEIDEFFINYLKLGDVYLWTDQPDKALAAYGKIIERAESLARAEPGNSNAALLLSTAYYRVIRLHETRGEADRAEAARKTAEEIQRKIDSGPVKTIEALALSFDRLGDQYTKVGQLKEGIAAYQHCLGILLKQAASAPKDIQAQKNLSFIYGKLGDRHQRIGEMAQAHGAFSQGLQIDQDVIKADPIDTQALKNGVVCAQGLGEIYAQAGQAEQAIGAYEQARILIEKLIQADAADAQAQYNLAITLQPLADLYGRVGQTGKARDAFQNILDLYQGMANPGDDIQRAIMVTYYKMGQVDEAEGKKKTAMTAYDNALAIARTLVEKYPDNDQAKADLSEIQNTIETR